MPIPVSHSGGGSMSSSVDVRAVVGAVVGGIVGLVVVIGLTWLWWRRRRFAPLRDFGEAKTEPTPFQTEPNLIPERVPAALAEKQQLLSSRKAPSLPSDNNPSPGESNDATHVPSTAEVRLDANLSTDRVRRDQLLGLRSEINDLRRIVLNAQVERVSELSDLGAPPGYSS